MESSSSSMVDLCVDWKETRTAHILNAELPGMEREEVEVRIEDDMTFHISGEMNLKKENSNHKWHIIERRRGKFMRSFNLPENVIKDQINVSMANGLLTITIPKDGKRPEEVWRWSYTSGGYPTSYADYQRLMLIQHPKS